MGMPQQTSDERFSSCIDACNAAANVCEWTASLCLQEISTRPSGRCVSFTLDCAEVCRLTANLLLRYSHLTTAMCFACIEACEACVDECGRFEGVHYERCVARCKGCIEQLWAMVNQQQASARDRGGRRAATA
jgi:hypothetical protein